MKEYDSHTLDFANEEVTGKQLSSELKISFFAQHLFCEMIYTGPWADDDEPSVSKLTGVSDTGYFIDAVEHCIEWKDQLDVLSLKILSSISEEDANQVWWMFRQYSEDLKAVSRQAVSDFITSQECRLPVAIYQYLQSKGYALPWMGISVDEQIQSGWIKTQLPF